MDFYDSDATIQEIEDDNTVPVINSPRLCSNNSNSSNNSSFVNSSSNNNSSIGGNASFNSINIETSDIQNDPSLMLHFCKMHGCGNDFVIFHVDSLRSEVTGQSVLPSLADLQLIARYLCNRTSGVGGNQLLVITPPPPQSEAQYQMLIFNSDGSMAENSGNGIRCLSKFIIDYQIPPYKGSRNHIIPPSLLSTSPLSSSPLSSSPSQYFLQHGFQAAEPLVPFFTRCEGSNPYHKLVARQPLFLTINTIAGIMQCCPLPAHPQNNARTLWVKVCMGRPKMVNTIEPQPTASPTIPKHVNISSLSTAEQCQLLIEQQQQQLLQQQPKLLSTQSNQEDYCKMLPFKGHFINSTLVSMGNPHCVVYLENVQDFPMDYYGEVIESHPIFPDKINVEFVEVIGRNQVRAKVWQRGCGTTNACGTGACAIAVAGVLRGKTDRKCTVHMDGGSLEVEWRSEDEYVYHSGPATTTFQGTVRFLLSELV